ncbi:hypothetical protein ACIPSA_44050 [Streptomyces sp. NPDC086549]|uniref:hypothetical protein n=1 Tax=Streptomyces sp. NPDC086549 TaxID=3365752 RepID=UPI003817C4A7
MVTADRHEGQKTQQEEVGSPAAAREIARRVALAPADWGMGVTKGDPYESEDMTEGVTDQNCDYASRSIANALAAMRRNVRKPDGTVLASSQIVVYRKPEFARADLSRLRSEVRRCPMVKEAEGLARWDGVHEVRIPELKGFDEVVGEEGRLVVDGDGRKADNYYTNLTGRKGQFVMQTYVTRNGKESQAENRRDATKALDLLLGRL